jgi:Divergent InlB B-repeat domain
VKTILHWRKHQYVSGVSILVVMMTLAMTVMGCDGGSGESYTLTINSTAGGAVTSPGEGTFTYDEGTVVNLVATADEGYEFQGWTGDTEDVADPGSLATTIILNQYSSITANFGPADSHGPGTP